MTPITSFTEYKLPLPQDKKMKCHGTEAVFVINAKPICPYLMINKHFFLYKPFTAWISRVLMSGRIVHIFSRAEFLTSV